jgi:DNA-binding SARP family transcriptional activator/tetratricopeptide (TPR) repeat protein
MTGPRFRVLGPLEVVDAAVRGPKQRTLLAVLLLHTGPVPTDVLMRALWGDRPPDTAMGQLHTRVWRLRRLLGDVVVTHAGGYELAVPATELDATLFAAAARRGRQLLDVGRHADAADELEAALRWWRGPALPDVADVPAVAVPLTELAERRLAAVHDLNEAGLAMGRHHELVPRLRTQVRRHPVREELRGQLMLALYRCGRQAEALQVYREGRRLLVSELGIEPGPTLHVLHERILTADPELDSGSLTVRPDAAPVVAQLPAGLTDLTGRDAVAEELVAHLHPGDRGVPPLVAVSGPGGTGKTSLAVHVAHRVAPGYPHGQLFVDLRGGADAMDPAIVLARFLRALGEDPRTLPDDVDERAALFRARTAGLRLLVVLDNAAGEAQLRPLLPAGPGCAVLVTSRRRLAALGATHAVDLGVLDPTSAAELLRRIITDRVAPAGTSSVGSAGGGSSPAGSSSAGSSSVEGDVDAVVRHCGYLPLAIRIAGARLAARPHWPPGRLAELLADERVRLDALNAGDLDVRSSIALSYRGLSERQRRALRLLACLDAPDVGAWVAGPLLDVAPAVADELVEGLVEARLLDVRPGTDPDDVRFGLHDLVRSFGRERAAAEGRPGERAAALGRAYGAWLALCEDSTGRLAAGFRRIAPGDAPRRTGLEPPVDPLAWLESERTALVATVHQAAADGSAAHARDLACALARFFELREHLDDWAATHHSALRAVRAAGDVRGEAHLLRGIGELDLDLDRYPQALDGLREALRLLDGLGDRDGRQHVLRAIGTALRLSGDVAGAAAHLAQAMDAATELGDTVGRAQALHGLGVLHRAAGRDEEAERHYRDALTAFDSCGDTFGQSYVLCSLGLLLGRAVPNVERPPGSAPPGSAPPGSAPPADGRAARVAEAEGHLRRSIELCRASGYRRGEALALGHLGDLHQRAGDLTAALPELRQALLACREVRERHGEAIILRRLGELHRDLGDPTTARSLLHQAVTLTDRLGMRHDHAVATAALAALTPATPPPVDNP